MSDMIYDPNVIPDWTGGQFPPGRAHVRIEALEDHEPTKTGKYQIRVTLRGLEPDDVKDQPHFERFVIGTDADPEGKDPNSWAGFAGRRYKDMLKKAGMDATGSIAKDIEGAVGRTLGVLVANEVQKETNRDGTPNAYAGRVQANIRSFFIYGEHPLPAPGGGMPAPVATARVATKPAATGPKPVTPVTQPATVNCSICNQSVLKARFAAHVAAHEANDE